MNVREIHYSLFSLLLSSAAENRATTHYSVLIALAQWEKTPKSEMEKTPTTLSSPSLGAYVKNVLSSMFASCLCCLLSSPELELPNLLPEGLFHSPIHLTVKKGFLQCYSALKNDYIKENLLISHTYSLGIRIASIYFSDSDTLVQFLFLLPLQNKYSPKEAGFYSLMCVASRAGVSVCVFTVVQLHR